MDYVFHFKNAEPRIVYKGSNNNTEQRTISATWKYVLNEENCCNAPNVHTSLRLYNGLDLESLQENIKVTVLFT